MENDVGEGGNDGYLTLYTIVNRKLSRYWSFSREFTVMWNKCLHLVFLKSLHISSSSLVICKFLMHVLMSM